MSTISIAKRKNANAFSVRTISSIAILAAVAYLLAFVEFPVPLSPAFARMDLSDLPALIGAFAFGPIAGLFIELVKNSLQLLTTSTGGVGELANFIIGASYVTAAGFIYKHRKQRKRHLSPALSRALLWALPRRSPTTSFCYRFSKISCRWISLLPPSASFFRLSAQSWILFCLTLFPLIC